MGLFDFLGSTVRLVLLGIGFLFLIVGLLLSVTFIGAIIGIPLIIVGVFFLLGAFVFVPVKKVKHVHVHKIKKEGSIDVKGERVK